MSTEVALGDEAAEGVAEHDRLVDLDRVTQPHHVVGPRVEVPLVGRAPIAAPLPAVVVHHHLRHVAQEVHAQLVRGVVHTRPAVQQKQRGPLHQLPVDRHEPQPVDIDVDPDPTTDVDAHVVAPTFRRGSCRCRSRCADGGSLPPSALPGYRHPALRRRAAGVSSPSPDPSTTARRSAGW